MENNPNERTLQTFANLLAFVTSDKVNFDIKGNELSSVNRLLGDAQVLLQDIQQNKLTVSQVPKEEQEAN